MSVIICVTVFVHTGWGRKMKEKDMTLYHHYRQKVMSIKADCQQQKAKIQ